MDEQADEPGGEKKQPGEADGASPAAQPGAAQASPAKDEDAAAAAAADVPPEPRAQALQRPGPSDIMVLHKLLGHRWLEVSMPNGRQQMVDEAIYELAYIVQGFNPEWGVRSFGSIQNGFATHDSDLDTTIVQPGVKQVEAQYAGEVLQQYMLPLLSNAKSGRFEITGTIAEARIPILKLRYWRSQVEVLDVDLSCYNTEAFPNTQLLLAYSQMGEGIIAALGVLVKLWAKSAGVSGAPQKHLSSYSIILMVLYFLQVVHKVPCLPTSVFDGSAEVPLEGRQQWSWQGPMTVLLWEFFKFYATDFQWGTEVVAIHIGQRTHNSDVRHQDLRGRWATRMHIEDPILTNRNLNAPLGLEQESQLKKAIWEAAVALQNGQLPIGLTPVAVPPPAPRPPPAGYPGYNVPLSPGIPPGYQTGNGRPAPQGPPALPYGYGGPPGAQRGPPMPQGALGLGQHGMPSPALAQARGAPLRPGALPAGLAGGGYESPQGLARPAAPQGGPCQHVVWKRRMRPTAALFNEGHALLVEAPPAESVPIPCLSSVSLQI